MSLMSLMTSTVTAFMAVALISGCNPREAGEARQDLQETKEQAVQDVNEAQSSATQKVQEAREEAREEVSEAKQDVNEAQQQSTQSGTSEPRQPASADQGQTQVTPELCRQLANERPLRPENQHLYDACAKANFDKQQK